MEREEGGGGWKILGGFVVMRLVFFQVLFFSFWGRRLFGFGGIRVWVILILRMSSRVGTLAVFRRWAERWVVLGWGKDWGGFWGFWKMGVKLGGERFWLWFWGEEG